MRNKNVLCLYDQQGTYAILDHIIASNQLKGFSITLIDLSSTPDWLSVVYEYLNNSYEYPALFITGTSLNHAKWFQVWEFAYRRHITTIAIVDSWQNLHERFITCSRYKTSWPTAICFIDQALRPTLQSIDSIKSELIFIGHPILTSLSFQSNTLTTNLQSDFLYVSEPIVSKSEYYDVSDLTHLQVNSFTQLCKLAALKKKSITIKLHPRESMSHFHQYQKLSTGTCHISLYPNSTKPYCTNTSWIAFGLTSMLLLELYLTGSACFSLLPDSPEYDSSFFNYHPHILPRLTALDALYGYNIQDFTNLTYNNCLYSFFSENSFELCVNKLIH